MVLMIAMMSRRSPAVGARVASMRLHSSSILDLQAIDLVIISRNLETQLAIGVGERRERAPQLFFYESTHVQDGISYVLEVFVEPSRNVLSQVFDFHNAHYMMA